MATWPANGTTDWNTAMLAYLAVEHNTDGTHKANAKYAPIDSTDTKIFTKYLTGTLDADSSTSVAHGVADFDKIRSFTTMAYDDGGDSAYKQADEAMMLDSAKIVESSSDSKTLTLASDTVRCGEGLCNSSLCGGTTA